MTGIVNASQYADWNGESGRRWAKDPDQRDKVLAPVADALLTAAGVSEHPVRWAWTSHRDRRQEGLALAGRREVADAWIIRLTAPAVARRWLPGI